jgi:hypothetical protein
MKNVYEIDQRHQFHQHFTSSVFLLKYFAKLLCAHQSDL